MGINNGNSTSFSRVATEVIKTIGVKPGQSVLDFGCGSGTYTIPAAGMVGKRGNVYALDKDRWELDNLVRRAEAAGLANIIRLDTPGGTQIALADASVDFILLFDVFHGYYFSKVTERQALLGEISRVLKPGGTLAVYPKHLETEASAEIEQAGFRLQDEFPLTLVHNQTDIQPGRIINFRR